MHYLHLSYHIYLWVSFEWIFHVYFPRSSILTESTSLHHHVKAWRQIRHGHAKRYAMLPKMVGNFWEVFSWRPIFLSTWPTHVLQGCWCVFVLALSYTFGCLLFRWDWVSHWFCNNTLPTIGEYKRLRRCHWKILVVNYWFTHVKECLIPVSFRYKA